MGIPADKDQLFELFCQLTEHDPMDTPVEFTLDGDAEGYGKNCPLNITDCKLEDGIIKVTMTHL